MKSYRNLLLHASWYPRLVDDGTSEVVTLEIEEAFRDKVLSKPPGATRKCNQQMAFNLREF